MSFARAQRFNYRKPDIDVSPADYNVSTSSFDKGIIIPKCARFRDSEQGLNPVCRRMCCCKKSGETSQYYSSDSSRDERNSDKANNLSRDDFKRSSFRRKSIIKKSSTPKPPPSKNKAKPASVSFESIPKDSQFLESEEFHDDDYHSYTSSEELDNLKKVEEYEFKEVCTAYSLLVENQKNKGFEKTLMDKLNNIEQTMEKFKTDYEEGTKKKQMEQLQQHHHSEETKMQNMKRYLEEELSDLPKTKFQEVLEIIANAIRNLNREFELKRRTILKRSERRILELIDELYAVSNSSAKEINFLCNETAISISKRLMDVIAPNSLSDLSLTHHCDNLLEKVQESFSKSHECFNYENICKLLSDKLQDTQDELQALEEDNLDITIKYHDTQQALEAQSSLIDVLHVELAKLKEEVENEN